MRKVEDHRREFLRPALASLLCFSLFVAASAAQNDPKARAKKLSQANFPHGKALENSDFPAGRTEWFLKGRRESGNKGEALPPPPARRLRNSFAQLDLALVSSNEHKERFELRPELSSDWIELGPSPQLQSEWGAVSGRVTSLALDLTNDPTGNTLYVGTAFGGVWKTNNALADNPNFVSLMDNKPNVTTLAIGSLSLDSSTNPPRLYVGTGETNNAIDSYYGLGIYVSPNGGASWAPAVSSDSDGHSFEGAGVSKILVDPENPSLVLAAVSEAGDPNSNSKHPDFGVYESRNSGQTWTRTLSNSCTDLAYDSVRKLYYAAVRGQGVFTYTPGVDKWIPTASPFTKAKPDTKNFYRASLAVLDRHVWLLMSTDPWGPDPPAGSLSRPDPQDTGLAQSEDGGKSWHAVGIADDVLANTQGWYDQILAAPKGSAGLIAGGIDVWYTPAVRNGKSAWANRTLSYKNGNVHPDQHAVAVVNATTWIVGNDGGLWITHDSGVSWINLNTNLGAIQFVGVTPDEASTGIVFGGSQDNGTAFNSAPSLPAWITSYGGDGGYTDVNPTDPQQRFAENYHVSLQRSDYFGGPWQTVVDGDVVSQIVDGKKQEDREAFYIPYAVLPGSLGHNAEVALGTFRVWRGPAVPSDSGVGWKPISADLTGGQGYIQAMAYDKSNPGVLYAVTSDGVVQKNEHIDDKDPSNLWVRVGKADLPSDRPYGAIAVDPKDPMVAYVGLMGFGVGHVFKTKDEGATWHDVTGNLQTFDTPVNSIVVDPSRTTDVYLGTDIGVFVSDDAAEGGQWRHYGTGLPRSAVLQLKLTSLGPPALIAATHGRGCWKIATLHQSPNFWLEIDRPIQRIVPGSIASPVTLTVKSSDNYSGSIQLACEGPNASKCSLGQSLLAPGQNVKITFGSAIPEGVAQFHISGTDGSKTHFQTIVVLAQSGERHHNQPRLPQSTKR